MIHNIFKWSGMTPDRKDAALGFYLWGIVATLVVSFSSDGFASWYAWIFFVASAACLLFSVFASEAFLVRALCWLNFPWPSL